MQNKHNLKTPRPLLTIPACTICKAHIPPNTHATHCDKCVARLIKLKQLLKKNDTTIINNHNNPIHSI